MSRTAVLKLAPAVLIAGLLLTTSTQTAQAWWYVPAYPGRVYGYTVRPVLRRPLLRRWGYYHRPLLRWHARRAYRHWPTVTYYSPAYCTSYVPTYYSGCCWAAPPIVYHESYLVPGWESAEPSDWRPAEPSNSDSAREEREADLPSVRTPAPKPSPPADPPSKPSATERSVYEAPMDDEQADDEEPMEDADDQLPAVPPALDEPPDEPPTLDFPGEDAGLPFEPAPALPLIPDEARAPQVPPGATILTVEVPADARVFVNDLPTQTSGSVRQYVSRGLQLGRQYTYQMRAEVERDGQLRSETRAVTVQAGQRASVAFTLQAPEPVQTLPAPETLLTLRVPEQARVTLEGRTTQATGNQRLFVTQALAEGEVWSDYRVLVEYEEEGVLQTREQRLRLVGGQQHELAFDFDSPQIAAR